MTTWPLHRARVWRTPDGKFPKQHPAEVHLGVVRTVRLSQEVEDAFVDHYERPLRTHRLRNQQLPREGRQRESYKGKKPEALPDQQQKGVGRVRHKSPAVVNFLEKIRKQSKDARNIAFHDEMLLRHALSNSGGRTSLPRSSRTGWRWRLERKQSASS